MAGFKSEWMAGFIGIRKEVLRPKFHSEFSDDSPDICCFTGFGDFSSDGGSIPFNEGR
jgi:hypothetical protein